MQNKNIFLLILVSCAFGAAQRYNKNIVYPCRPITEQCVRDNLEANSKCTTVGLGSLPSEYTYGGFRFETPYFNSSQVESDLVIKNHNRCTVSEFFYNLEKDLAVLSLDCRGLVFSSNRTLIQHASYQEDTSYSFSSTWEYPLVRLTANIPNANAMDICNAFVFTDVAQMPNFVLNPNDKPTKSFLSSDLSYVPIYERETFFYRGPQLFRNYMSTCICNFGCYN